MSPWAGHSEVLSSAEVGDDFAISVAVPHRYDPAGPGYPVLVVLDAHWLFGTVHDLVVSLGMGRQLPRAVVVGVGYPSDDLADIARKRYRDATPTAAPFPPGNWAPDADRYGLGRDGSFRAFLRDELRPWLEANYRTSGPWTLVGHSLTGLFGVNTLLDAPETFDAYLLASPSLWWDERVTLSRAEEAPPPRGLPPVFLSAGAEEDRPPATTPGSATFRMVHNVERLGQLLAEKGYEPGRLHVEMLPGETHHSTIGQAVSRGLRILLGSSG